MPTTGDEYRDIVMRVLGAALQAAGPAEAVRRALPRVMPLLEGKRILVVGAGKASASMLAAAYQLLGDRIAGGLVIVKEGHAGPPVGMPGVEIREAAHPVPDYRGLEATTRLLEIVSDAGEGDLLLCLISGGGSALLTAPAPGLTLEDTQAATDLLLRSGATINELNTVRKHLSRVSGGRLAALAQPAPVVSLILSDVTGSPLDVIASGPTVPDPTTYNDALSVLDRYGISRAVPRSVIAHLRRGAAGEQDETPKPGDPIFMGITNIVVVDNVIAVQAAEAQARQEGLDTAVLSTFVEGEAREVGKVLAGMAREVSTHGRPVRRPGCLLFGGETTVTVKGRGTGGRNSELALSSALGLRGMGAGTIIASLATDGGDGASPGSGGIVDGTTIDRGEAMGLDAVAALADNDSYTYLRHTGDTIKTGPTGTNVNDVMAVFVF